jgi:pyruvate dehydrogenase E1 component
MASFIAAGTAYSNHGVNMIPFFTFYSMFGFQRIGDMAWAAADARARGFLVGATSGRTTLAGEGLQHQDGHSHLLALPIPNLMAYDPAYAYEIAVIVREGIRRMFFDGDDVFYYLTVMNEKYVQPPMPEGEDVREGILRGLYRVRAAEGEGTPVQLIGSGAILNEAIKAQAILAERFKVAAGVWSATSYKELHSDALECERWNTRHPSERPREPWITTCLADTEGPIVCASDYVKALPDCVSRWMPRPPVVLGTDGFGRSDGRESLRDFFEVDAKHIVLAAISRLAREDALDYEDVEEYMRDEGIEPGKPDPTYL